MTLAPRLQEEVGRRQFDAYLTDWPLGPLAEHPAEYAEHSAECDEQYAEHAAEHAERYADALRRNSYACTMGQWMCRTPAPWVSGCVVRLYHGSVDVSCACTMGQWTCRTLHHGSVDVSYACTMGQSMPASQTYV